MEKYEKKNNFLGNPWVFQHLNTLICSGILNLLMTCANEHHHTICLQKNCVVLVIVLHVDLYPWTV